MSIPEVIVGAVILNRRGEVFLMSSPKWESQYIIPGGHVEYRESLHDALAREIKEETGLDIAGVRLMDVDELIDGDRHFVFINYVCRHCGGRLCLNDEGDSGEFYQFEQAFDLPLARSTRNLLERTSAFLNAEESGENRR